MKKENKIIEIQDLLMKQMKRLDEAVGKEMNKEITIKDVYSKLCEILEVLKNDNR